MKTKNTLRSFLLACSTLLAATSLHAANIWDGGGGDGNWSTAANWDNNTVPAATGQTLTFTGDLQTTTTNDTLAGITAVNGFNFTNNGTVGTSAFSLAGDPLTLAGNITTTATSSPITDTISLDLALNADRTFTMNTDHNLAVSGIISDDGDRQLIKNGPGVLTLSGANTFGRLNHDVGTVRAGAAGQVFGDNFVDLANGTTLDLNGFNVTVGGLQSSSPGAAITLGSGTLTFGDSTSRTLYSTVSGSGKIIYAGTGTTQTQLGTNSSNAPTYTHTGGTQVDSGRLKIYKDASLGDPNGNVIFNGGTIYVNGGSGTTLSSPSTRGFILNNVSGSTILFQGNNDWYINGPISGNGGIILRQNPNGDTEGHLLGTNSFNGPLRIQGTSGGAMRVWISNLADSPTQNGNIIFGDEFNTLNDNNSQTLYFDSAATAPLTFDNRSIEFEGNGDAIGYLRNDNTTHAITVSTDLVNSGTGLKSFQLYAVDATPVNVFSGVISDGSGTVSLRKAGNGQWTLSGANTHTGGTLLAAGTLIVDSAGGDGLGAGPFSRSNGNLVLNANQTVPALYVGGFQQPAGVYASGDFAWLSGTGTLTVGSVLPVYWDLDDSVAGPGDTAGDASGTWNVGNTNWSDSAAGDVATAAWTAGRAATFSAGTSATATSTVTVDGTQDIGGFTFEEGNVTLASGTTPALRLTSDALALVNSGATGTVDAPITDDGTAWTLIKGGPNTLTLNGANTYTGTTKIDGGTLLAGSTTALGNGGDITFAGGTLRYNSTSAAGDFSTPARFVNSASAITVDTNGENVTMAGNIDSTNTAGLTKLGAGTLTLGGTNSYSGTTTISAGSLVVNGGTLSSKVNLNVANTAMSVTNNGTLNSSGVATFAASNVTMSVVGGSGVTSTWNLGATDLSTGNTTYDNQQLVIDGAGFEGSAVVTGVNKLRWGRTNTNSDIVITDGGQMNVTGGDTEIGNPYYSTTGGSTMTIGGGTATSTFTGSTGRDFYIGYGERTGSNNNVVTVTSGGVLTSIRDMIVGHIRDAQNGDNVSTNNQLLVTGTGTASMRDLSVGYVQISNTPPRRANANLVTVSSGGTMSTSGTTYVGRAIIAGGEANSNTVTVSGTGSSWNAGGQAMNVGFTSNASATATGNVLTVGASGVVTNVNNLTVGNGGGGGTVTGNQVVVNGSLTATSVSVSSGNNLGGTGTINGPVTFDSGATATFTQGSPMTITGVMTYNSTEVHLNLPAGLGNGVYTLATSSSTPVLVGSFPTPVVDSGSYGSGGTGAISLVGNDLVLTVSGVSGGDPYGDWATGGELFGNDENNDGVSNGLAFLLGAGAPGDNALGLLPEVSENDGDLIMTFDCRTTANRGGAVLSLQFSSDLGDIDPWTTVAVPGVAGNTTDGSVSFVATAIGDLIHIVATIDASEAAGGKLFGRLQATE